jgi:hypothetical protein
VSTEQEAPRLFIALMLRERTFSAQDRRDPLAIEFRGKIAKSLRGDYEVNRK